MAMPNSAIQGAFNVVAHLTAKPGKGDELQPLLSGVRASSTDTNKEPGCLGYITVRGGGEDSDKFTVFETYESKDALAHHRTTEPYLALKNSGLIADLSVGFYQEFK